MNIAPVLLKEYPQLNDAQKAIIGHRDGPLLVIAGPGSGKTFSLVLRALNLFLLRETLPRELVICTFTDIDYWAVDWDFQNDTFMQGWVTYRTRKDRTLGLTSDPHTYEKPGKYRILVKVVDIFGNDTSQAFDVEVK
ncbi:MAG: UvrD-helicase domain-containing protein [Thermodesulfobacteriota bacterium]